MNSIDPPVSPKRGLLKLFGVGLVGGASVLASKALATAGAEPYAMCAKVQWVHGHGSIVGDPTRIEVSHCSASSRQLRGTSYSTNAFHFLIPSPPLRAGTLTYVNKVYVRYRTASGASIIGLRVFDGELIVMEQTGLEFRSEEWTQQEFRFDHPIGVKTALGISLCAAFGSTDREIEISALGCEFSA